MEMTKIVQSVHDRLEADTGTGGLFATGANLITDVYSFRAGRVAQGNAYIVLMPTSATATNDFDNNVQDWALSVSIYADAQLTAAVGPRVSAIADRVFVRLNDWTPTLTNWTACGPWVFTDAGAPELPDEDSLMWIMNFELIQSQARA